MQFSRYTSLLLVFLVQFAFSQAENTNVAILDLEANAVTAQEARTLTDKLRGVLFRTGQFTVLERGQMDAVLSKQGFQQTGCTSSECVVEAGQLLGVRNMVAGSIGKVGTIFVISLRMIDVRTGQVVRTVEQEIEGQVAEVLRSGIPVIAWKLAGSEKDSEVIEPLPEPAPKPSSPPDEEAQADRSPERHGICRRGCAEGHAESARTLGKGGVRFSLLWAWHFAQCQTR